LVVVSLGLCLQAERSDIARLLDCCERGDPLFETIVAAAAPGLQSAKTEPAFYELWDALYDACREQTPAVASPRRHVVAPPVGPRIRRYLDAWYREKMEGFLFVDKHLVETETPDYVGYWCFEVAGVVAAIGIDDRPFADHVHYPADLVSYYRTARSASR
jgi:hypothetical protein